MTISTSYSKSVLLVYLELFDPKIPIREAVDLFIFYSKRNTHGWKTAGQENAILLII